MSRSSQNEAANWEILLWSLYRSGGFDSFVDIEVVFIKCFEIAPNRFSWRTRKEYPDYKKCAKALQEAERRRPALLIKTKDGLKRQLSVEGQKWVEINHERIGLMLESGRVVQEPITRPHIKFLTELERSDEYLAWLELKITPEEKWRVADLFRCSPDSDQDVWRSRLEVMKSAARSAGKEDVLDFLERLYNDHKDWFDRGK